MKYVFTILGTLPALWEDFFCTVAGAKVNISIYSQQYLLEEGDDPLDYLHEDEGDGWSDMVTMSPVITEDIAKQELAGMLGVSPELVVIRQQGLFQSV